MITNRFMTALLAFFVLGLGAWAQEESGTTPDYSEVKLQFKRTGTNVASTTVRVLDKNGDEIDGVTATLTSTPDDFKSTGNDVTESILCPNKNANTSPTIKLTFTIKGLPTTCSFNAIALDIHALRDSREYQLNNDGKVRQWNVTVQQGASSMADFVSWSDIDIAAGVGTNEDVHKQWLRGALSSFNVAASHQITLTITKGTVNNGCFFGLSEIVLKSYAYDDVVYEYKVAGTGFTSDVKTSDPVAYTAGSAISPSHVDFTNQKVTPIPNSVMPEETLDENGTVTRTTAVVDVTYNLDYPFTLSPDPTAEDATFYTAYPKEATKAICYKHEISADGVELEYVRCNNTRQKDVNYLWCFVPDTHAPWRVKVYSLGTERYMTVTSPEDYTRVSLTSEGTAFDICSVSDNTSRFMLRHPSRQENGKNAYVGSHGAPIGSLVNSNNCLAVYYGTGDNSKWNVQEINTTDFLYSQDLLEDPEYVGQYVAPEELATAYAAYVAAQTRTNLKSYLEAYATYGSQVYQYELTSGHYYRIVSNRGGNAMLSTSNTYAIGNDGYTKVVDADPWREVQRKATDTADLSALWTPETSTDGWKWKNLNSGMYLATPIAFDRNPNDVDPEETARGSFLGNDEAEWTIENGVDKNLVCIKAQDGTYLNAWSGPSSMGIGLYGGATDVGNQWKIQRVKAIPVTLDAAGWASLVLPYAVEIPGGVTVYYATTTDASDGKLALTEWQSEDNILATNTPVFLKGEPNTPLSLTISAENGTGAENNELTGCTHRRYNADGNWGVWGLKAGSGMLAKAGISLTTLPANRAFLPSLVTTASAVRFHFGMETGIEDVPAHEEQGAAGSAYYDLTGRRVLSPKSGIFVTAEGKKVVIR